MLSAMRLLIFALIMVTVGPPPARADLPPGLLDSVVSVLPDWPDAERLPEEPEGSGVAVLAGGYVMTAAHVLGRARTVRVRYRDGIVGVARIAGRDEATDLALLKVGRDLPAIAPAPMPALGAPACAIGNPFGLGLSVTCGVVSAVHRTNTGFNVIEDFVQTDASVNPGASGGALVDAGGRLLGVLSAIFTRKSDADIGVNFAASAALAGRVARDLAAHGHVRRVASGLVVRTLDAGEAARSAGVAVNRVGADSPAAAVRVGDIIVEAGGIPVRKPGHVSAAFYIAGPGARVMITLLRGGKQLVIPIDLPQ